MSYDTRGNIHRPKGPDGGQFAGRTRAESTVPLTAPVPDELERVLESAAELQRRVPDAVLVGGSAAALYAGHRLSFDHDHVVQDLGDRFDIVLDALDSEGDFVLDRATPGKIILGSLGGIEAGVRQLIRKRPLETTEVTLRSGARLIVPTADETLRIKAFLTVRRNQTRDYLDVAALANRYGIEHAAGVLSAIDEYYADDTRPGVDQVVRAQIERQLAAPEPKDHSTTRKLSQYKGLVRKWHDWADVVEVTASIADRMARMP